MPKSDSSTPRPRQTQKADHASDQVGPALIIALAILAMVGSVSTDMFLAGLPRIRVDLNTTTATVQLTLSLFMVGMAVGQLFWGPLSDRLGRRGPLLVAVTLFALSSIAAPLATNIWMLVSIRLVQGFTGSAGVVIGRAVARDRARGIQLAKVFSFIGMVLGIAPIASPIIGGLVIGTIGWRGVLWIVFGVGVLMAISAFALIPESLPEQHRLRGGSREFFGTLGDVVRDVPFLGYTASAIFGFGAMFSYISGSSVVMQERYGLNGLQYTLCFAVNAVGMLLMGFVNSRIVGRVQPDKILRVATGVMLAGSVVLFVLGELLPNMPVWLVIVLVFVTTTVNPLIMANTSTLGLSRHRKGAGMASAFMGMLQYAVAGAVSPLVAVGGTVTLRSMSLVMVVSAALAVAGNVVTRVSLRRRGETGHMTDDSGHEQHPEPAPDSLPDSEAVPTDIQDPGSTRSVDSATERTEA
ncbi:multidrug effflux MFS transporter [Brooklawnia cerclae]|uniref:DHA1 family bicyclomycin/chloramphenicol resistance-like MFS transporter n=1 Tax=Brooklawnia cerclae TaxID=349934 RepID=A0ABX0SFP0_9ACTN|nr:DHA1 family bicyclomycin/chloramphenicol resistance-like MFS transporter [Brooklawnia cerclae]